MSPPGPHTRAGLALTAALLALGTAAYFGQGQTVVVARTQLSGTYPQALAVDEQTGHIFVAQSDRNLVSMLDGSTGAVLRTVRVGGNPVVLTAAPASGLVFAANQDDDSLDVLDAASGRLLRTIPLQLGDYPGAALSITGMPYDRRRARLFVTGGAGRVSMIDARSGRVLRTATGLPASITVLGGPLIYDPAGRLYLLQPGAPGLVSVLDASSLALLKTIVVGADAQGLALDSRARRLAVMGRRELRLLDTHTWRPVRRATLPTPAQTATVDEAAGRLFVAGGDGSSLAMLDSRSGALLGTVRTAPLSAMPALDASRHLLYVPTSNGLLALDSRTGAPLRTLPGDNADAVAIDGRSGRVFFTSFGPAEPGRLHWLPGGLRRWLPGWLGAASSAATTAGVTVLREPS